MLTISSKSHANREKGIPSLNGSYGQFGTFLLKLDLTFCPIAEVKPCWAGLVLGRMTN